MKILQILIILFFISSASIIWFFPSVLRNALIKKPSLYLIPDYKKSAHLIESFPRHNQFLVASPTLVKLQFDKELQTYDGKVTFAGTAIQKGRKIDETNKTLLIPLKEFAQNGIYQVNYSVCFAQNDCSDGQFAYKVDIAKMTGFSNYSNKDVVKVIVSEKGIEPQNILIDAGTQIQWEYQGGNQLLIDGSTFALSAAKESESDVLGVSSSAEMFNTPGEYVYTINGNPSLTGRIFVYNKTK